MATDYIPEVENTETKLAITCVFADTTTAKITIGKIKKSNLNLNDIRAKVMAFNQAKGGDLATKLKSDNGFNWIGISKVTVTTTARDYIF